MSNKKKSRSRDMTQYVAQTESIASDGSMFEEHNMCRFSDII